MAKPKKHKTWQDIESTVEQRYLERYNGVPKEQRIKLGLEPTTNPKTYENRQWVQIYVQMLEWKDMCRQLHDQLYPLQPVANPAGEQKEKE
tara:strand:+ start:3700 stop:3972 length:273 start_codon:yes stop_codon:yes gene_type:complete